MAENQEIIFDIQVKTTDAVKKIAELKLSNEDLKKSQKELQDKIKEGGDEEQTYREKLAATQEQYKNNQKAIQALSKEVQNNMTIGNEQAGVIEKLKAQLSNTTAEWNKLTEAEQEEKGADYQKTMADLTAKLKEAEQAHGDFRRSVGDYEQATVNLRAELKQYVAQLQEMKLAGKDNTAEFQELIQKTAEVKKAINDVGEVVKNTSKNTAVLSGLNEAVQTLAGGFGLFQSAVGLADTENQHLNDTIKNLQIAMAALSSLIAIQNALKKESAMMTLANNAATKIATGIMSLFGVSVVVTSTAFKLLRAAIISTGIGILAVAIGELVAHWEDLTKWLKTSTDGMSEFGKAINTVKEVAMGVWEVIKTYIISPFAALGDIMKGDFMGAMNEMKKGIDVVGNYQKGANAQRVKDEQATQQKLLDAANAANSKALLGTAGVLEKSLEVDKARGVSAEELYKEEMAILDMKIAGYRIALNAIKDVNSDAYKEQQKNLEDAMQKRDVTQASETKRLADVAKQRAKDAATAAKEQQQNQLDAIRQMQDSALELVKEGVEKQRQTIIQTADRQIEDIKIKLATEKNLTVTARQAMNDTIVNLEQKKIQDLDKLNDDAIAAQIDKEQKRIELQLAAVKSGTEEEYNLKMQSIANQRDAELTANRALAEELRQDEADINAKYDKQVIQTTDARNKEIYNKQSKQLDLELQNRLLQVQQGSLEQYDMEVQNAQDKYDAILNMDDATKKALGISQEQYTNMVLNAEKNMQDATTKRNKAYAESVATQLDAAQQIGEGFQQVLEAFAGDNETLAAFAKTVALFNIALSTGEAIAKGIAAAQDVPFPGNLAAIATTIAAVLANVAKAKQLLSSEKQPKAPKFATGGIVTGQGSGTSDSIVANLSNGESIMTASATSMFGPVLSALNQIGGGVPINVVQAAQQQIGEDMLTRSFSRALEKMPRPVMDYSEYTDFVSKVELQERLSRQ